VVRIPPLNSRWFVARAPHKKLCWNQTNGAEIRLSDLLQRDLQTHGEHALLYLRRVLKELFQDQVIL
jgi:hypothetical protein